MIEQNQKTPSKRKEVFLINLRRLMKKNKLKNQAELADTAGFRRTTVNSWITGNGYPGERSLVKLAAFFHVEVSDLTDDHSASGPDYLNRREWEIVRSYRTSPEFRGVVEMILDEKNSPGRTRHLEEYLSELKKLNDKKG